MGIGSRDGSAGSDERLHPGVSQATTVELVQERVEVPPPLAAAAGHRPAGRLILPLDDQP